MNMLLMVALMCGLSMTFTSCKDDSHWITLSALPEANIFHHPGSNNIDYYLPKDLGANTTHEKNFAEMLYAVLNPDKWEQNVLNNRKLDMFNGFDRDYLEFHNAGFWKQRPLHQR